MINIKLTIEYDGTDFFGWQIQPDKRTVQKEIELALEEITNEKVRSQWESIWREHSPRRQISSAVDYFPCIGYKWLYSVAGESGLDTFVRELTHRARNQISLSFEDYMQYFSMRVRRFERTLDSTELKLTSAVVESPNLPDPLPA